MGQSRPRCATIVVYPWAAVTWLSGVNVDLVPSLDPAALAQGLEVVAFPLDERRKERWHEQRQDFGAQLFDAVATRL